MKSTYVITSMGQISSMGSSLDQLRQNFIKNKTGYCIGEYSNKPYIVGKISNFDFFMQGFKIKTYIDRTSQLCAYAVNQAYNNVDNFHIPESRIGLVTASNFGCLDSASKYLHQLKTLRKARFASPLYFTHSIANIPNSIATTECNIKGYCNHLFGSAEAGLIGIMQAIMSIQCGQADYVFVGGIDSLSEELIIQLEALNIISNNIDFGKIIGAFDKERRYAFWGEGAGVLGIERKESALSSGRRVIAEIKGIGLTTNYCRNQNPMKKSMEEALQKSKLQSENIDFVVANANGTISTDRKEAAAITSVLGNNVPVFAPKSYFGETSSAAGILGIISALQMNKNQLPKNQYLFEKEEGLNINAEYSELEIKDGSVFIVNGINHGGTSVSVCIQAERGE